MFQQEINKKEFEVNNLLSILFNEKSTNDSIEIFAELKLRFENELKKRNLNALIEKSDIEAYFKNTKEIPVNFEIVEPNKNKNYE